MTWERSPIDRPTEPRQRQAVSGATVLIVDDDNDFREALADTLKVEGYQVTDARTGKEALELLDDAVASRRALPDLLVLDLLMPTVSGVEVLQQLRETPALADLEVLIVTSANDQMLPVRLDLPVAFKTDVSAVLNAIRQQLARRRPVPR
jgi:two-component system cell cycle response regulator